MFKTSLLLILLLALGCAAFADQKKTSCSDVPEYKLLDFWVGDWVVYEGDKQVGTNRIEKILGGCAVLENWTESDGSEGKSFFYFNRNTSRWKQVWVQDDGFFKEKEYQPDAVKDGVRFQGEVTLPDGRKIQDRTTLTPLSDGRVRQVIEGSRDGKEWKVGFDAIYVRKK